MSKKSSILTGTKLVSAVALLALAGPAQAASPSKCTEWTKQNFWQDATAADVRDCISAGAKPNARDERSGWTPLHNAAYLGRSTTAIQALLDAGADVDV